MKPLRQHSVTEFRNVRVRPDGGRHPWPSSTSEQVVLRDRDYLTRNGIPADEIETESRTVTTTEWKPCR